MSVTRDEVARIAALAALDVEAGARDEMATQLSRILDYVSQLASIDAEPGGTFRPQSNDEPLPLRDDAVVPHTPPLDPRALGPDVRDGLFVVPRIGAHDAEGDA